MKGGTNCNSNSGTSYNGLIGFEGNSSNNINININIPSNYNQLEDEIRVSAHAMNMINVMPQEQDCGSSSTNQTHHHHDQHQQMIKAKILAHPLFPRLLAAYVNCQKVGAPPEVVGRLEQASSSLCAMRMMRVNVASSIEEGAAGGGDDDGDPALDQFMEAYCEMLIKYHQELTKPIKEAMLFLSTIHSQLHALTTPNNSSSHQSASKGDCVGGSECSESEDVDVNASYIDPEAEDGELKVELLRKYSGYLGSLKQKFLKTKKNGKLPEEARRQLLQWWTAHYKWPYPSEAEKVVLAESTGLDLKQINNWFINQRKRHWKPSEDHMQFDFMDAATTHHPRTHHYTDNNVMIWKPFPLD